jgi:hypothetical protein
MAATVCDNDPRTVGQRRSDALGALANGNDRLRCACGSPTCPATAGQTSTKSSVVVTVVADQTAIEAARESVTAAHVPGTDVGTAILSGRDLLPTPMLAELLRAGATLQPLCIPADEPEQKYRPSATLARWIRTRDLTCRFPGCTVPADMCDIDHVVPYPIGPTHPTNLACLCRKHHHMKTFWTGDWALTLRPDGAAIWTAPTGHTYTTQPGCRTVFPHWDPTTAELPGPPPVTPPTPERGTKMPLRKRTRAADRNARIKAERAQNDSDPPPF